MRLYNTLTRREEPFAPSVDNTVRMYTCGLTVYARGHIGNFRTFVCLDVLRRTLKYLEGHEVRQVMNFTDVDDRTILGAQKAGMELRAYTDQYIAAFREDARALGLEEVEEMPRATDQANLQAMADLIAALARNGHTYVSDGSDLLQDLDDAELRAAGAPGPRGHEGRRARRLGQLREGRCARFRAVEGDASQESRRGTWWIRPAVRAGTSSARRWRCGCSGESPIDIHAGGIDLIFPHHENEIAQSEGATGKQFSRFWVHVEYLLVNDEKMSKSLGNTYTIPDVVAKGHRASAVRYLLLSAHYRKQLNFTWESLGAGRSGAAAADGFPGPARHGQGRSPRTR